eukprot:20408-Heterococcus_DN1.PRE.4
MTRGSTSFPIEPPLCHAPHQRRRRNTVLSCMAVRGVAYEPVTAMAHKPTESANWLAVIQLKASMACALSIFTLAHVSDYTMCLSYQ